MEQALTIQLFFFAAALTVALEAYKAQGIARIVLWASCAIFGVVGFAWSSITEGLPALTTWFGSLVSSPTTWFIVVVSLYFVLRRYWSVSPPEIGVQHEVPQPYDDADIKRKLEKLEAIQGTCIRDISTVDKKASDSFGIIEQRLREVEEVASIVRKEERRKSAQYLFEQLKPLNVQKPYAATGSRRMGNNMSIMGHVQSGLLGLGIEQAEIDHIKAEIEKAVMGDAKYLQFSDDDQKIYQSPEEKRQFTLVELQHQALFKIIEDIAAGR